MLVLLVGTKIPLADANKLGEPSFVAFDCDKPTNVKGTAVPVDCQTRPRNVSLGPSQNVSLWQETTSSTGILCRVDITEFYSYCGVWSHQAFIAPGRILRPQEVSVQECRRMNQDGVWKDESGHDHQVMGEGETYLNYVQAGTLAYHHDKITCRGTQVEMGGKTYKSVVKLVDVKVSIKTVVLEREEEGYRVEGEHLYVRHREVHMGGVELGQEGALLVGPHRAKGQEGCNLELLGHLRVQVQRASGENGFSRILYSHQRKVYLLQSNTTRKVGDCDKKRFWATNLPGIFVRRETRSSAEEPDHPTVNVLNVINELRDFTAAELKMDIERARLRETCLRYLNSLKGVQVGFQQGHSAGTFTEIKGEVATSIQCTEVSVRAAPEQESCFVDMPVSYLGEQKFLEPISRILKDHAAAGACEKAPAVFSRDGRLFQVKLELEELPALQEVETRIKMTEETSVGQGVYPAEALEAAQQLLRGRWREERRLRGEKWNLSQPIWEPEEGGGEWSLADLFDSHRWTTWVGKTLLGVVGALVTLQGGAWAVGMVGACRGGKEASPGVAMGIARRIWAVTKSVMCHHYGEGLQRGSRAVHRGGEDQALSHNNTPFNLNSTTGSP